MIALHALRALGLAGTGIVATSTSYLAEAASGPSDIAPWVSGGGSAVAVGALAYMARLIANGKLVARDVALYETELKGQIRAAGDREDTAMHLAVDYKEMAIEARGREASLLIGQGESNKLLEEVRSELRYWQDRRISRGGTSDDRRE